MSAHYIYLSCPVPGCTAHESIYTGNIETELFSDSGPTSWEGETISIKCKEHEDE